MEQTCLDCQDRTPGCHDTCQRYLKAKMKNDIAKQRRDDEKHKYAIHYGFKKKIVNGSVKIEPGDNRKRRKKNWIVSEE